MGAGLDVLASCDGASNSPEDDIRAGRPGRAGAAPGWQEDASVGCAALEEATKSAIASANRGGTRISDEVLLNHELLQHARQGNVKGLSAALDKGAWTETRRPLVMKPQKPEVVGGKNPADGGDGKQDKGEQVEVGMTALMFSAQSGSAECVRRLLWASAEVNAVEEDGWSALHFAAKETNLEVCKALLQSRADGSIVNAEDKTPLQVAQEAEDDVDFIHRLAALIAKAK